MNSEQKERKRKEKRRLAKDRKEEKRELLLKALEEVIDSDPENVDEAVMEESEESETCDAEEIQQKSMDGYPTLVSYVPGPTSFDELDAERVAREEAQAVQEVVWDTESLVRNILEHGEMEPEEKVTAIHAVADAFGERVGIELADEKKDIDLLEIEATIATDKRTINLPEQVLDMIAKATLTAKREAKMSDDQFGMVAERDGIKVRKYPIHDKAHVRNALARAAQMINRGGQAASDAKAALPNIKDAAKRMGIGVEDKKKELSAIQIEKDKNGDWRWVGWLSNKWIDWDGDIICEDAHKEYVDWWDKNKDLSPVFVSWHTPGTRRESVVDLMMYESGFLIASGKLTEPEAQGLLKAKAKCDIGMSHGTFVLERDVEDRRIIKKYRMYECSDLAMENSANPFTDFDTIVKEVGMDKKLYLASILGSEELAEKFMERTKVKKENLDAAGIESKEQQPPVEPQVVQQPPEVPVVVAKTLPVSETPSPSVDEVVTKVLKELDLPGLNTFVLQAKEAMEKVPVLEALVKDLQGTQEDKLAEMLTPPAAKFAWSLENRPSQSDDTKIDKNAKLAKEAPGVDPSYWLSEATKTAPVKVE